MTGETFFTPGKVDVFNKKFKVNAPGPKARLRRFRCRLTRIYLGGKYHKFDKTCINLENGLLHKLIRCEKDFFDIWWDDSYKSDVLTNYAIASDLFSLYAYRKKMDYWFDKDLFDWENLSELFIKNSIFDIMWEHRDKINFNKIETLDALLYSHHDRFNVWWQHLTNQQQDMIYEQSSSELISQCSSSFNVWWNKDKINVQEHIYNFMDREYEKTFPIWFNKYQTEPEMMTALSNTFCVYFPKHFKLWFDKETFNYNSMSALLPVLFKEHFDMWWDSSKFNYRANFRKYSWLIRNEVKGTHISLSFVMRNGEFARDLLIAFCSDKISDWWSKLHYRPTNELFNMLDAYCEDNKDMWIKDYIKFELKK